MNNRRYFGTPLRDVLNVIPYSMLMMGVPRYARAASTVLIRIKAVIYVEWALPDKFRGKEGRWSVGSL